MSNIEHYFENLLFHGKDCKGEPNKKALSPEVQNAIETCATYIMYSVFNNEEELRDFLQAQIDDSIIEWALKYMENKYD